MSFSALENAEQGAPDEMPDGLREHEGKIEFECRSCGRWTQWEADIADFEFGGHENMCGGSPRCCP